MIGLNKKEIVSRNIYLIKHFASKYYVDDFNIDYNTLVLAGMSGLLESIDNYNVKAGLKFSLFASNNIKFKILDEIKRTSSLTQEDVLQVKKYALDYLLNFYNSTDNNQNETNLKHSYNIDKKFKNKCLIVYTAYLNDFLLDSININANELLEIFDTGIKKLSNLEQQVLYMYYTEEFDYLQIRHLLDIPEDNIFFIHTIALAKLKEYLSSVINN